MKRKIVFACLLVIAALFAFVLVDGWTAFGARATGGRLARLQASPQWRDGHVVNPQPLHNYFWRSLASLWRRSPDVSPAVQPLRPPPWSTSKARRRWRRRPSPAFASPGWGTRRRWARSRATAS